MEKILLTIFTFLLILLPWAESDGMKVLTRADGLAGESVGCICSDSQGQMWFGTTNGISMYNGKTITSFRLNDGKHRKIHTNGIVAASDGSIYATTSYGLFVLPMGQSKFKHIMPEMDVLKNIYIIDNTIYIGSNKGMYIYDHGKVKNVKVATSTSGIENTVRCIQPKSKGHLYINNRHELFDYNINTGRLTSLGLKKVLPQNVSLGSFVIWKDKVFFGTKNNGLFVFSPSTQKLRQVKGFGFIISSITLSKDNKLCVATDGAGAFLINPDTEQVIHKFDTQQNEDSKLPTDATYFYYRAPNGVDWIGVARHGVSYNYNCSNLFQTYTFDTFSSKGINVRSFYIHGAEKIIGTLHGFYYINEDTHTIRYFSPNELNGAHIVTNCIYYQNEYYIATYDGGLKILNPKTLQLRPQNIHPVLNSITVFPFNIDKSNRLWIGSSEGLFIVSPTNNYLVIKGKRLNSGALRQAIYRLSGAITDVTKKANTPQTNHKTLQLDNDTILLVWKLDSSVNARIKPVFDECYKSTASTFTLRGISIALTGNSLHLPTSVDEIMFYDQETLYSKYPKLNPGTTYIKHSEIDIKSDTDYIYDLQGRRISSPKQKGIYIKSGKKIVVH